MTQRITRAALRYFYPIAAVAFIIIANVACAASSPPRTSSHHKQIVLSYLRPILHNAQLVARLSYAASSCQYFSNDPMPFPAIRVQPASNTARGLVAVKDVFRHDADVTVHLSQPDIVQIDIGSVRTNFLSTRIENLTLTPLGQYNAIDAIEDIVHNAEVQTVMGHLGIHRPFGLIDHLSAEPDPKLPHLPPSMKDVTIDQALNAIARTFNGIIVYGDCRAGDLFDIEFVPIEL